MNAGWQTPVIGTAAVPVPTIGKRVRVAGDLRGARCPGLALRGCCKRPATIPNNFGWGRSDCRMNAECDQLSACVRRPDPAAKRWRRSYHGYPSSAAANAAVRPMKAR